MNTQCFFNLNKLYAVVVLLSSHNAFAAANFNIEPYGSLPTSVTAGQTVTANFTVTNITNTARNGYTLQGFPATVTQNTTSPNCGNPINLEPHASCNLQLDITGEISSNFAICKLNSCTTATTPLNVALNSTPPAPTARYIYITTDANTVLVCALNNQASFNPLDCEDATPPSYSFRRLQGIVINTTGTTAYLTGNGQDPYQCSINAVTKHFDSCTQTSINTGDYFYPTTGMLGLSTGGDEVFISNWADGSSFGGLSITRCPIVNQTIEDNCVSSAGLTADADGLGVAVNSTHVYASNYSYPYVSACTLANWGSPCTILSGVNVGGTDIAFSNPSAVALNSNSSILYIGSSDTPSVVYGCSPTNISGSNFGSCFIATEFTSGIWSMVINAKNSDAYYTDKDNNRLYHCKVAQNGTIPFSDCESLAFIVSPIDTALLY